MALIDVKGVRVNFPFEPYPCQMTYMEKVLQCLQTGENGILESPTGTGKTLCLLCSSLAWLENRKQKVEFKLCAGAAAVISEAGKENVEQGVPAAVLAGFERSTGCASWGSDEFVIPKIIYASRTHSQLSQAIQELKRTAYNGMKTAIIGSRDQLCVNEQVRKEKNNSSKVRMCRAKVSAKLCHYHNVLEALKNKTEARQVVGNVTDIEDLVLHGTKNKVCPYYLARELKSDADIIFMPYNYLLDPKSRKAHGVELQGNIVIFDEAHNLERICEESASFELSSVDLATAIEETTQLGIKLTEMASSEDDLGDLGDGVTMPEFTLTDVIRLKKTLLELEECIDDEPLTDKAVTKPGLYVFELMDKVNITFTNKGFVIDLIDKMISHFNNDGTSGALHSKGAGLAKVLDALKIIFNCDPAENIGLSQHKQSIAQHYKVHIQLKENGQQMNRKLDSWASAGAQGKSERVLSYWCFNPGYSMQDLKAQGVKTVILTSGTLSPMDSFATEMQIPFTVRLENPHVIEKQQVFVGTLGCGPDGTVLNSNYENRFKESYKSSLGNAIVNFARIVPKGLLVFFPSYPVMNTCVESWQNGNIWDRIMSHKPVVLEPRGKDAFTEAIEDFYKKISDSRNGAVFMAVCRGKVSEGLDFADMNGRAVVITGLPYPPMKDPRVMLKMKHLDGLRSQQGSVSLSGQQWYKQQATRAVNQAIGRVIRHKDDFGAIMLCDTRFASQESVSGLPMWVKRYVTKYDSFGRVLKDMLTFFRVAEQTLPVPVIRHNRQKDGERTGSGCTGAFFEPTVTRRTAETEHASSVACHVPGFSRHSSEQTMSSLKSQYSLSGSSTSSCSNVKKRGLLHALDATEKLIENASSLPETTVSSNEGMVKIYSRKRKIVIRPRNTAIPSSSKPESTAAVTTVSTSKIVDTRKSDGHHASEKYAAEVKSSVTELDYRKFTSALKQYKQSGCLNVVIPVLADLFTSHSDHFHLLHKFYRFVKPQHKAEFNQLCVSLTGQSCGYKPEHALTGKQLVHDEQMEKPDKKRKKLVSASSSSCSLGQWSAACPSSTASLGISTASGVVHAAANAIATVTSASDSKRMHLQHCGDSDKIMNVCGSVPETGSCNIIRGENSLCEQSHNMKEPANHELEIPSCRTGVPTTQSKSSTGNSKLAVTKSHPVKGCDIPTSVKSSASASDSALNASVNSISKAATDADTESPDHRSSMGIDIKKLSMMSNDVNKLVPRTGYICCKCTKEAHVPFYLDPCEHVCCFKCWRIVLEGDKQCPGGCGHTVRRRKLQQLMFLSGKDVS